ncbi:MAG TPA: hypothetical protein DIT67_00615 [Octadecabacter sp.]|nr:hypothetical protein [Octadecabacter sp.]
MTQQSIQIQIDREKDRQSRIDAQLAVTPKHQLKRLDAVRRQAELALARVYGHRLDARVSARIVDGLILSPEVLCTIGGGVNELPTTVQGWDSFASELAEREPLAKLSLDHSDAQLKEDIRQSTLAAMRPTERLKLARAGTLDSHLDGVFQSQIESRAGL